MSEATTIFDTAMACHYAFKEATSSPRLMHQEWAENRLADFNLWSSGAGASTTGKASLDRRLRANPEARTILINLLLMLKILVQKCIDGGTCHTTHRLRLIIQTLLTLPSRENCSCYSRAV